MEQEREDSTQWINYVLLLLFGIAIGIGIST